MPLNSIRYQSEVLPLISNFSPPFKYPTTEAEVLAEDLILKLLLTLITSPLEEVVSLGFSTGFSEGLGSTGFVGASALSSFT